MSKSSSGPTVRKSVGFSNKVIKKTPYYPEYSGDEGADSDYETDDTNFDSKDRPIPRPRQEPEPEPKPKPKFTITVFESGKRIIPIIQLNYKKDITGNKIIRYLPTIDILYEAIKGKFINDYCNINLVCNGIPITDNNLTFEQLGILENANIIANISGEEVPDEADADEGGSRKRNKRRKTIRKRKTGKKRKTIRRRKTI